MANDRAFEPFAVEAFRSQPANREGAAIELSGAVLMAVKKLNKAAYCYHFINFAALCAVPIGWILLPPNVMMLFSVSYAKVPDDSSVDRKSVV